MSLGDIGSFLFGSAASTGDIINTVAKLAGTGISLASILGGDTPSQQAATQQQQVGQNQIDMAKEILGYGRDAAGYTKGLVGQSVDAQGNVINASQAPITDARGNKSSYTPGQGYTSSLSDRSQQLQDASDAEYLAQLTHDLPQYRAGLDTNAARRSTEGNAASSLLDEATGLDNPYSLQSLRDDMTEQATRGVNDAYTDETGRVASQALRSGTNGGAITAALMKQRAKDTSDAILSARIQAPQAYEGLQTSRQGRQNSLLQDYGNMATRASDIGTPNFNPSTIGTDATSQLNTFRNGLGLASTAAGGIASAGGVAGQTAAQNTFAANPAFQTGVAALTQGNAALGNTPDPLRAVGEAVGGIGSLFGNSYNASNAYNAMSRPTTYADDTGGQASTNPAKMGIM